MRKVVSIANNPIACCMLIFLIGGQIPGESAGQSSDQTPIVREIKLRTDYLKGSNDHLAESFDVVRVQNVGAGCKLSFLRGKRHSMMIWQERQAALSEEECSSIWALVDRQAIEAPKLSNSCDKSEEGLRYQLVILWKVNQSDPANNSSPFSRIVWGDKCDLDSCSSVARLVQKLRSLKGRLAPPAVVIRKEEDAAGQMIIVPSKYSGIRGHVSHPHGIPWDRRKVYPIRVIVLNERQAEVLAFATDEDGNYQVKLQPGTYTVCPGSCTDPIAGRGKKIAVVESGGLTVVNLHYDSGIR